LLPALELALARREAVDSRRSAPGGVDGDQVADKSEVFVLLVVPHHGGSGRATVFSRTRKEARHVLVEVRA
jgi:hypothetical protein